ncbi:MAG: SGNH/GDSL hydrolase family protein [Myxococcota bacterium]
MRRLALAVVATLLALAACEGALRLHEGTLTFPDDGRRFATRPGTRGTNSRGFHDREDVPKGGIAVLGDSMTWGTTTWEEAWPRVAEARVGRPVLNYSHYGYDAAQSAATLRHHVWGDAPSRIVYAAYANDLVPTRLITVGELAIPAWLGPRTALGRAILGAWHVRRPGEAEDVAAFDAALADMATQAREHDVPLLVFGLAPWRLGDLERLRIVEARCAGVPFASVVPYLRGSPGDYAPANRDDGEHPGPAGHRLFAAAFADVLGRWERGEPLPRVDDPPITMAP